MSVENTTNNIGEKKRFKRKKKNSRFMRNAKGFAKQGIYGRGTHIDDDQYTYFINILDAMKNGFEDAEEKVNMANNVFEQTADQEIHLSSNQIVCKALETLVGYVDAGNLERFFKVFAGNFRPICSDRFASHVLQKMVEISFLRALGKDSLKLEDASENEATVAKKQKTDLINEVDYNLETEFSAEHRQKCSEFVERVSKFMLNNLEDFVWDSCANHIMRTCILSLSGVHVPKVAFEKGVAEMAKSRTLYTVPAEWFELMKEFPQRLEMWPHFVDFPFQEHSSALLGVICIALKMVDKNMLKHFGKKILMEAFLKPADNQDEKEVDKKIEISDDDDDNEEHVEPDSTRTENAAEQNSELKVDDASAGIRLPKVYECQSSVILLETLLSVAGPKLLTQLYAMLFTGRLAHLAKQQQTNFAVQKLLQNIKEKSDFENICSELFEHTEELLKMGYTGVVAALVAACLRLTTKQSQIIVALQNALHVPSSDKEKSKYFFQCLIKLKPYAITFEDKSSFVHLHGSLIVQHILKFNKPIYLVNCILDLSPDRLVSVFNTPNGSHISDAFLQSKFIGEKSREKLIRHFEGFYVDLAVTRPGSRVIENFYEASQDAQKARIVKELADKSNLLKGTAYGRLLFNKLRIETYRLSAAQWKASLHKKENKTEQLFKDILS